MPRYPASSLQREISATCRRYSACGTSFDCGQVEKISIVVCSFSVEPPSSPPTLAHVHASGNPGLMRGGPVRVHPRDRNQPAVERHLVEVSLEVIVRRRLADLDRA